mgnify:CR=1 FL=1
MDHKTRETKDDAKYVIMPKSWALEGEGIKAYNDRISNYVGDIWYTGATSGNPGTKIRHGLSESKFANPDAENPASLIEEK